MLVENCGGDVDVFLVFVVFRDVRRQPRLQAAHQLELAYFRVAAIERRNVKRVPNRGLDAYALCIICGDHDGVGAKFGLGGDARDFLFGRLVLVG